MNPEALKVVTLLTEIHLILLQAQSKMAEARRLFIEANAPQGPGTPDQAVSQASIYLVAAQIDTANLISRINPSCDLRGQR